MTGSFTIRDAHCRELLKGTYVNEDRPDLLRVLYTALTEDVGRRGCYEPYALFAITLTGPQRDPQEEFRFRVPPLEHVA
jgi:hypothetical protein